MPRTNRNIERLKAKTALRPGEVFAVRLHEARTAKGWTQQRLAERLVELGFDGKNGRPQIGRTNLAKLEGGDEKRYLNVQLADVLAIGLALSVYPLYLFMPLDSECEVQLTPRVKVSPETARSWGRAERFYGYYPSPEGGTEVEGWDSLVAELPDYQFCLTQMPRAESLAALAKTEPQQS